MKILLSHVMDCRFGMHYRKLFSRRARITSKNTCHSIYAGYYPWGITDYKFCQLIIITQLLIFNNKQNKIGLVDIIDVRN